MSNVTKACRDVGELTKNAQTACTMFLKECKKQGLDVLITETYRSQERQNYLYEQGRTRPGQKVTWTKNSRHTSRRAWDICKNEKGKEYSDTAFFKKCGAVAKKFGIIWGGTWKTPDMPHFEISAEWKHKGEEFDMEEFEKFKAQYADYVNHTSNIINTMGKEIESLKSIINVVGNEIAELKTMCKRDK